MVGLESDVVDYSDPAYAIFPGINAKLLREALEKDRAAVVPCMGAAYIGASKTRFQIWDEAVLGWQCA